MVELITIALLTILAMLMVKMYFEREDSYRCRALKQVAIFDFVLAILALILYFLR